MVKNINSFDIQFATKIHAVIRERESSETEEGGVEKREEEEELKRGRRGRS